jgi:hypothetical protein
MWGPLFAASTGGDSAFGREQEAKKWMQGPFAERQLGLGSEASKRERLARISPESKEYDRFQEELNRRNAIAKEQANLAGMFGETGFSRRFTG